MLLTWLPRSLGWANQMRLIKAGSGTTWYRALQCRVKARPGRAYYWTTNDCMNELPVCKSSVFLEWLIMYGRVLCTDALGWTCSAAWDSVNLTVVLGVQLLSRLTGWGERRMLIFSLILMMKQKPKICLSLDTWIGQAERAWSCAKTNCAKLWAAHLGSTNLLNEMH